MTLQQIWLIWLFGAVGLMTTTIINGRNRARAAIILLAMAATMLALGGTP
jgi:hypothetical protein